MTEATPGQFVNVTINLPADLVEWLDGHLELGQTRADAIRQIVETLHRREFEREQFTAGEREIDEQYVRSYREHPQEEDMVPWPAGVAAGASEDGRGESRDGDATRRDLVGQSPASLGSPAGPAADQG